MEKFYWYDECVSCHQGRLILTEDITNKRMYLHCEECERGWFTPEEASEKAKSFLTLEEDFETENPDWNSIQQYGWEKAAKHYFSE